jgi:alginate O-acetyltransferase complex protein AlgI
MPSWSEELACLVAATSAMDYLIGRGMDATKRRFPRCFLLMFSLVMNLGLLCYFKYMNFFLESLHNAMRSMGEIPETTFQALDIILPFGISFYTFEAISYTIDVYRRKIPAERSLPNFMLFILFFPHLVAGPIVRAGDFLPQAARPKRFSWLRMQLGVQWFLMGLFMKMAIADRMAIYSDPIFTDPGTFSTSAIWLGVLAFALRIYCDFAGYSAMALGCAHMLGYKLTINFRMPYLSLNVSEFWRRWHISLSTWLRDYLFIPLGGSRGSGWKTARNLMITMLLGGLWHGANWTFLIWGGLHGAMLVTHRLFRNWCEDRPV